MPTKTRSSEYVGPFYLWNYKALLNGELGEPIAHISFGARGLCQLSAFCFISCGCLPYGWEMLHGGAVGLVVGPKASVGLPTLVGPADWWSSSCWTATFVLGAAPGLDVDEGVTTGLDVVEEAVNAVDAGLDEVDGCAVGTTLWVGCEDGVAWEGLTCTGWDEVGATWVRKDEAEVGWVDGEATGCAAEGAAVGDVVAGVAGVTAGVAAG